MGHWPLEAVGKVLPKRKNNLGAQLKCLHSCSEARPVLLMKALVKKMELTSYKKKVREVFPAKYFAISDIKYSE